MLLIDVPSTNITYNVDTDTFIDNVFLLDFLRYLKGIYTNKERFKNNFIDHLTTAVRMHGREDRVENLNLLLYYYDRVSPFSYKEAFEINNTNFKTLVFGSININEMIEFLGNKRIEVQGVPCKHRKYKEDQSFKIEENTLIYELHEIPLNNLGVNEVAYAVKCWCTTTNKEHWLWVDEIYAKKGVLEAIASTCMIYENMLSKIEYIKRQGDIFLFEMKEKIIPDGEKRPLSAKEYFSLLVSQS